MFITLLVGTWLTLFNQGSILLNLPISLERLSVVFLNYLTPFVVANVGLLSRGDSN